MLIVAESDPAGLVASIVIDELPVTALGVPEIIPVVVLKTRPLGKEPLVIDQEVIAPPEFIGTRSVIVVFLVNKNGDPVNEMLGASSWTEILIVAESDPAGLVASIVIDELPVTASGVPEIIPVVVLKTRPLGNEPLVIDQEVIAPPEFIGTKSVIVVFFVYRNGEPV